MEHGDEPDTGVHVYELEKDKDYWVENVPHHKEHCEDCPMVPGNYEKILLLNECKRLALDNQYDTVDARNILRLAKVFDETQKYALRKSKCLIVDATFGVVQEPHKQLLTIHVSMKRANGNTVNMPIAFALMQSKSEPAYIAVFNKIK